MLCHETRRVSKHTDFLKRNINGSTATSIFDVNTGVYYEKLKKRKVGKVTNLGFEKRRKEKEKENKKETPLNERNCVDSNLHLTYLQLMKRG